MYLCTIQLIYISVENFVSVSADNQCGMISKIRIIPGVRFSFWNLISAGYYVQEICVNQKYLYDNDWFSPKFFTKSC